MVLRKNRIMNMRLDTRGVGKNELGSETDTRVLLKEMKRIGKDD